jgi:hypothetical protein
MAEWQKIEPGPCLWCGQFVTDESEAAGAPEGSPPAWAASDGDYGCDASPETCDEGCGAHARPNDAARWLLLIASANTDAARLSRALSEEYRG